MAEESRRQFALEELTFLFAVLEKLGHPCVLMGGQAACYWARRYLPSESALPELGAVSGFLSKDADFQGSREAAVVFAAAFGNKLEAPGFREAFGNLMAGKFSVGVGGAAMNVEVLRKVPGLTAHEVEKFASFERVGDYTARVLNPVAMLKAKSWNVVNITKEGRHDAEQLLALVPCVRAFLRASLARGADDKVQLRGALNFIEYLLRFTELPAGRKTAEKCGVDWSQILPHNFIAASTRPEVVRLREKRLPGWLAHIALYRRAVPASETHQKMLAILARHAEPLCIDSPFPIRPSTFR